MGNAVLIPSKKKKKKKSNRVRFLRKILLLLARAFLNYVFRRPSGSENGEKERERE